ncbi:MAG TPA: hypothetical protein DCM08_05975 [Microscillaceae bacterium]|nr:hypothetical protein [Microscillaceae bacterium]
MEHHEEIEIYFTEYLQGTLAEPQKSAVESYLQNSESARQYLEEFKMLLEDFDQMPLVMPPNKLKQNFESMLSKTIQEEKQRFSLHRKAAREISLWEKPAFKWSAAAVVALLLAFVGVFSIGLLNQQKMKQEAAQAPSKESEKSKDPGVSIPEETSSPTQLLSKNETTEPRKEEKLDNSEVVEGPFFQTAPTFKNFEKALAINDAMKPQTEENQNEQILISDADALAKDKSKIESKKRKKADFGDNQNTQSNMGLSQAQYAKKDINTNRYDAQESTQKLEKIYANQVNATELIQLLNQDPSPNVRLAALDALEGTMYETTLQKELMASLQNQQASAVQMAIIDLLIKYDIPKGDQALKKLLKSAQIHESVKLYAQQALKLFS